MRYNFSLFKQRSNFPYIREGFMIICCLLASFNLFYPWFHPVKKPEVFLQKLQIHPIIKADILKFLIQLSVLDIRLLSADIYPQEIMIKGLSFKADHFLSFLKNSQNLSSIKQKELIDWHRSKEGCWYFCLRIIFKP